MSLHYYNLYHDSPDYYLSCLSCFEAIATAVDRHTAALSKAQREMFFITAASIMQLVQRYRSGTRGHMRIVIDELLRCYLKCEIHFHVCSCWAFWMLRWKIAFTE